MTTGTNENHEKYPADMQVPIRTWHQRLTAAIIILLILACGIVIAWYLIKTKPQARRKPPAKMQILVETRTIGPTTANVTVRSYGRVAAAQEINVQARVTGTVRALHPQFVPGGIIKEGDVLAQLDDTDYRLELTRAENAFNQARADLRIEEGNQAVARQEWELIKQKSRGLDDSSIDLALRKPQLEKVKAAVDSAKTEVERVKIDLERTIIKVPFNAIVKQKNVDIGSQVTTQTTLATLVGTDAFWVEVSVPVDSLQWLELPENTKAGSPVKIIGEQQSTYEGKIIKLLPGVEQDGLMARLLVEVSDPLGLHSGQSHLLLGDFVEVAITGKQLNDVYQVPRSAVKDGNRVYTVAADTTLHIQQVNVLYRDSDSVFISDGLKPGDRIIITNVASAMEGLPLLLNEAEKSTKKGQEMTEKKNHGRP